VQQDAAPAAAEGLALAADGLALEPEAPGCWRVAFGERDWLGPVGLRVEGAPAPVLAGARRLSGADDLGAFESLELEWQGLALPLATSVRAYAERPLLVFRLEALEAIEGLASGHFGTPSVAWPWLLPARRRPGGVPEGTRGYAHQYTEFAFPTFSDASLANFLLFPHRPRVVTPLWLNAPDGRSLMLAPLADFHDQVIAVPPGPEHAALGVRCGWHGDLEGVPAGFATELAVWAGPGPRRVLEEWAACLRRRFGTRRLSRYADQSVARLSYWTDNGAAYWYRTEPGHDVAATLEATARELRAAGLPVCAFELDSWFYPHEVPRPVNPQGQVHVPPSGALLWEAREDVLPAGIEDLRRRLGDPPLVAHARHFSSRSPYWDETPAWIDGDRAHPIDPAFFERLLHQAAQWGVTTFEQDWLVEMYLGVRQLRARPGRARAWQEAVDRAAARHGLTLLWCMATPADFLQTLTLERIVAIRTSGDYRYLAPNPSNWVRFLYTNALARALGLHAFKDVFLSDPSGTGLDGDPHAEAEALLSALSAGPVGLGDRVGRSRREIALRTCREDGVLVKPDLPLAAIERCLRADCYFEPEPLVGETWSQHPAGRWVYVVAMNAWREERPLELRLPLSELGAAAPDAPVVAYDWRSGRCERLEPAGELRARLAPGDWHFRVLCPLLDGLGVFGDVARYACAGDRRIGRIRRTDGGLELDVLGSPGETCEIGGFCEGDVAAELWEPGRGARSLGVERRAAGGFRVRVAIGASGWCSLRLRPSRR
jgi:hypothetical protein